MKKVDRIKMADDRIVKRNALLGEIIPLGISRMAVRGFFASKLLSKYRLKAIAALRAVIIQMITRGSLKTQSQNKESGNQPIVLFKFH